MIELAENSAQKDALLSFVSRAISKALTIDPQMLEQVRALNGRVIRFRVDGLEREINLQFHGDEVSVSGGHLDQVDVELSGKISDFIALARNQREGESMSAGQVEIQGDLATAQRIQNMMRNATVDWEELLAQYTGDVFAYQVGTVARKGLRWIKHTINAAEHDIADYVKYEKKITPTTEEIHDFSQAVDDISLKVERLELRLSRLSLTGTSS